MPYIIQNTQDVLTAEPGHVYPSVRCYLSADGEWTLTKPAMTFTEKSHAEDAIKDSGLNVGRNVYPLQNRVNVVEAVEV